MSYRKSGSNPVRLHLSIFDAEELRDMMHRVEYTGQSEQQRLTARRFKLRLDARLKEARRT